MYSSFAPPRLFSRATWLVDGKQSFDEMTTALENAKKEVLMSWWIM
jgi:hypothetical protein